MAHGVQHIMKWFGIEWPVTGTSASGVRLHTLVGSLLAAPIYSVFALTNLYSYGAVKMGTVTSTAAIVALCALLLLGRNTNNTTPGHCFTLALAIQVFGEMTLNGGLQAPAAALSLLIVPAAIFTAGVSAVVIWGSITIIAISVIGIMDFRGWLPANELPLAAQQFDRVFSLCAGILITSVLVYLFQRQANKAIDKLSEERTIFRHNALHDTLTDMPNRRYFYEHVNKSLDSAILNSGKLTLFYFDIDRFKLINDQFGHSAGDELLKFFAERLNNCKQSNDLAARLSGDEFALVADIDVYSIEGYVERLRSIMNKPFMLGGKSHDIGMSIGFASFPHDGTDLDILLRVADQRMYDDKAARRLNKPAKVNNIVQLAQDTNSADAEEANPKPLRKSG